jgi:site-specific recombinase XerD
VQRSYSRKNGFSTPKNDKSRELPLAWDACAALRVHRELVTSELVFPGKDDKPLDDHATGYVIEKIMEKLEMRRIHNHVLRHTFASHAVMCGIPIRQVQEWLGHSNITQTMRYSHLAKSVGDEMIQRLAPDRAPDPAPADGARSDRGAARSQHTGGTQKRRSSKTPLQLVESGRS